MKTIREKNVGHFMGCDLVIRKEGENKFEANQHLEEAEKQLIKVINKYYGISTDEEIEKQINEQRN